MYTSLHRLAGAQAGPISSRLLRQLQDRPLTRAPRLALTEGLPGPKEFAEIVGGVVNVGGGTVLCGARRNDDGRISFPGIEPPSASTMTALQGASVLGLAPALHGVQLSSVPMGSRAVLVAVVPASDSIPHLSPGRLGLRLPLRDARSAFDGSEAQLRSRYISSTYRTHTPWRGAHNRLRPIDDAGVIVDLRAWPRLEPGSDQPLDEAELVDLLARASERAGELLPPFALNPLSSMRIVRDVDRWTLRRSDVMDEAVELITHIDLLDDGRLTHQTANTPTTTLTPSSRARLVELATVAVTALVEWLGEFTGSDAYAVHLRFPDERTTWPHGGAAPPSHPRIYSEVLHTDNPEHNAIASSHLAWSANASIAETNSATLLCDPDWRALELTRPDVGSPLGVFRQIPD